MFFKLLGCLALVGTALGAVTCHQKGDSIGPSCQFNPDTDAFMQAANVYCGQFNYAFDIPAGSSSSNVYQMKIGNLWDGWEGKQIFWGNYKITGGGQWHHISRHECVGYMYDISQACNGYGGWIDTYFGTVFGECIVQ